MRTNVILDERTMAGIEKFPRKVSMSAVMRCLMTALTTNDAEWGSLLESDPGLKKTRDALRDYLRSTGRKHISL